MPRLARVVAPGHPHHVTQRGNRRHETFFGDDDYRLYISLMAEWCERRGVEIWAWCLMPNHVHLIAVPETAEALPRAVGEAHRRYSRAVNMRKGWCGHLWQGRFASYVMDEKHLLAAVPYVELNPVRAGLAASAEEWQWSSARAHLGLGSDPLTAEAEVLRMAGDWREFLEKPLTEAERVKIAGHERTGKPLGTDEFVERMEKTLGRPLKSRKR